MGEITTRTIGPEFAGDDEPTLEEQIAAAEAQAAVPALPTGPAEDTEPTEEQADPVSLDEYRAEAAVEQEGPVIQATYFKSEPHVVLNAQLMVGTLDNLLLSLDEAERLYTSLGEALTAATNG